MKVSQLALAALVGLAAGSAAAQVQKPASNSLLSNRDGSVLVNNYTPQPVGATVACLPTTDIESWDAIDDTDNIVMSLNIGAGNELTGVAFDVQIETIAPSWLSEAAVLFSDSTGSADPNGINLTPGVGNDAPGTMDFSSGGVIDFATNMLPNIVAGADGILRLEFFETFDDTADAIDGFWRDIATTPATCPGLRLVCTDQASCDAAVGGGGGPGPLPPATPVPALNTVGLAALAFLMMLGGAVLMRRRQSN